MFCALLGFLVLRLLEKYFNQSVKRCKITSTVKVIYDTREQYPLDLQLFGFEMVRGTIKTGDYAVEGLDLCIERKRNTGEISMNLGSKWKQFEAELDRMVAFSHKYIVCEFTLDDIDTFPAGSGIPRKRWKYLRMSSGFIKKRFFEETEKRNIEVVFAGSKERAEEYVADIITSLIKNDI